MKYHSPQLPMNRDNPDQPDELHGRRVAILGRLAGMAKREAGALLKQHGAIMVPKPDRSVDLVVVPDHESPLAEADRLERLFDARDEQGNRQVFRPEVISETTLWQRLGLVDIEPEVHRLYTPAMLAELLDVPVAVIRRWHRRGLITPCRTVRKLAYFDFQEVATARWLAELLAAGMSPTVIEKKLATLVGYLPEVDRPLARLSVVIQGKEILLRREAGLIEPGGQSRFDFDASDIPSGDVPGESPLMSLPVAEHGAEVMPTPQNTDLVSRATDVASRLAGESAHGPDEATVLCHIADEMEETGQLHAAADLYRSALAAGGVEAETCFQLAEVLYRLGDLAGARERYYMTIELDEDYVEARANLGCVLAETGRQDLAVAAFQGALRYHADYADVHYHLACVLDHLGQRDDARSHWQTFLELAPNSPWADQARARLCDPP